MESLTHGTHWSVDPTGQRNKNRAGGGTLRARLELDGGQFTGGDVRRDLLDLAHLMSRLAGPIVDASDDGGGNGGAARRDHGGTPVEATTKHKRAQTSFPGLRQTYRARLHGLRWREVPQPR